MEQESELAYKLTRRAMAIESDSIVSFMSKRCWNISTELSAN